MPYSRRMRICLPSPVTPRRSRRWLVAVTCMLALVASTAWARVGTPGSAAGDPSLNPLCHSLRVLTFALSGAVPGERNGGSGVVATMGIRN